MNQNYQLRLIFPLAFHEYTFEKEDFNKDELVDFCYTQKKLNPKGIDRSNRGGWHSRIFDIKKEKESPISIVLAKGLGKSVFTSCNQQLAVHVEYWIMINHKNTSNSMHTHPRAHLSGVMWIKAPENSGDLRIMNPNHFESHSEIRSYIKDVKQNTNIHESYHYLPIEGKMVTFPPHVYHEVKENKSEEDRIAVAYNISFIFPENKYDY